MDRRSFLGSLAAILGLGAAASVAKPAAKIAGLDKQTLVGNPDVELLLPLVPTQLPDAEKCGQYLADPCLPFYQRPRTWTGNSSATPAPVTAFGFQAIGITCPKCGNVGGPACPCGWHYDQLFETCKPNRTLEQIKAAPLGYRAPDDFYRPGPNDQIFDPQHGIAKAWVATEPTLNGSPIGTNLVGPLPSITFKDEKSS